MAEKYKYTIKYAQMSVWTNLAFALGKLIIGLFALSFFLCVNAMYNVGVALAKYTAVRTHKTLMAQPMSRKKAHTLIYKCYLYMGLIVLISSIAYMVGSVRLFLGEDNTQYNLIVAISIAAFTFTELTIAIIGAIRTRKINRPIVEAVKFTNFSSSLISLVLTQTALLSMNGTDMSTYNGIASMVFGSLAGLIGLYMIFHSYNMLAGNYYKILIKLSNNALKRFGFVAVRYIREINTLYVTDLTDENKKYFKKLNANLRDEFRLEKNVDTQSTSVIENNEKVDKENQKCTRNDTVIKDNESNLGDYTSNIENVEMKENENLMFILKPSFVRYSKKEIEEATPEQRFQMAKNLINSRYHFKIEYKDNY